MDRQLMNKGLNALLFTGAFYMAFMIGIQTWSFVLTMWDPFYYYGVKVLTPVVHRCGEFAEELDVQRNRVCKVDIDRFMINIATGDVMLRERVPGGATQLGRGKAVNKIPIACDAALGRTKLIQNVSSQCIDGVHTMPWPVLEFEIIE